MIATTTTRFVIRSDDLIDFIKQYFIVEEVLESMTVYGIHYAIIKTITLTEQITKDEIIRKIDERIKEIRKYDKPRTYMGTNTIDEVNTLKQSVEDEQKRNNQKN